MFHQCAHDPCLRGAQFGPEAGTFRSILTISVPLGIRTLTGKNHEWQSTPTPYRWSVRLGCPFPSGMGEGNNSPVGAGGATRLTGLTPAQDSVSSLVGLREEAALWEKSRLSIKPSRTGCPFSTLGVAPFLGDQVATGFEVQRLGELGQVVQFGQVDALEIFVNQDFGPAQERRELARIERSIGQEPVQVTGELAVSFGHRR